MVDRDIAATLRLKNAYRLDDLKLFYFVTSEGDACVGDRKTADIASSLLFNCRPDALVVGGMAAGSGPAGKLLEQVAEVAKGTPVVCGTGCKQENIEYVLCRCNGAFVGSAFKKNGLFDNPVDEARVRRFMDKVHMLRGE